MGCCAYLAVPDLFHPKRSRHWDETSLVLFLGWVSSGGAHQQIFLWGRG